MLTTVNAAQGRGNFVNHAGMATYQPMIDDDLRVEDILFCKVGTKFVVANTESVLTVVDPFADYIELLRGEFDFEKIGALLESENFNMVFDGMHGAGGPVSEREMATDIMATSTTELT